MCVKERERERVREIKFELYRWKFIALLQRLILPQKILFSLLYFYRLFRARITFDSFNEIDPTFDLQSGSAKLFIQRDGKEIVTSSTHPTYFLTPLPRLLLGSPMLMDPQPSQQHAGLQNAILWSFKFTYPFVWTWSSLVEGDEGWIGPSKKLFCLC